MPTKKETAQKPKIEYVSVNITGAQFSYLTHHHERAIDFVKSVIADVESLSAKTYCGNL
jgi:hypothetical protein